jgi:hypothetical protein
MTCNICFEDFNTDSQTHTMECGHVYHRYCLEKFISHGKKNEKRTCPYCRKDFDMKKFRKENILNTDDCTNIIIGDKVWINSTKYKGVLGTVRDVTTYMYNIELFGENNKLIRVKQNKVSQFK